jgi:hypothetical protein
MKPLSALALFLVLATASYACEEPSGSCSLEDRTATCLQRPENPCKNAGTLASNGTCLCLPQFAGDRCQRLRKSQTTTFLLAFFFTEFGAANFYLQNYLVGTLEFLAGFPFLILITYADLRSLITKTPYSPRMWRVKMVWFLALIPVWILGWRRALRGAYRDGFGDEMLYDLVWNEEQVLEVGFQ